MKQNILRLKLSFFILAVTLFQITAQEVKTELFKALEKIEGVEIVEEIRHNSSFSEAFEIKFTQPIDHNIPEGAKFTQRMFIGHVGFDKPMVISTSGYGAQGLGFAEPVRFVKGNLIRVEHRYFGGSVPEPLVWEPITWDFSLTPYNMDTTFNPITLPFLHDFVQNRGDHILYIYGEKDTWTATGVKLTGPADALVMILPGGYHGSRISAFPEEQKKRIFDTLQRWLGMELE